MTRRAKVMVQTRTHELECEVLLRTCGPRARAALQCDGRKLQIQCACSVRHTGGQMRLLASGLHQSGMRPAVAAFMRKVRLYV